jgi:hypothetical protein
MEHELDLDKSVAELAELVLTGGLNPDFRARAKALSGDLEFDDIADLKWLLHRDLPEPAVYDTEIHGLGGWISACQFAAFEMLYNLRETALPAIREIAWGEYDWTQGNAIELMIRFAAEGIRASELIAEIRARFPDIRYEAQLYAVEPLVGRIDNDPALAAVFAELERCKAFEETVAELRRHLQQP